MAQATALPRHAAPGAQRRTAAQSTPRTSPWSPKPGRLSCLCHETLPMIRHVAAAPNHALREMLGAPGSFANPCNRPPKAARRSEHPGSGLLIHRRKVALPAGNSEGRRCRAFPRRRRRARRGADRLAAKLGYHPPAEGLLNGHANARVAAARVDAALALLRAGQAIPHQRGLHVLVAWHDTWQRSTAFLPQRTSSGLPMLEN